MGLETLKEIIVRIATDQEYRAKFFDEKTKADSLKHYESSLTEEEKLCLYELTPDRVEEYVRKDLTKCQDIRI